MRSEKPNVIWILCDQMRAQALSCAGDPNVNTPNIDLLAATGVRFTHAVSGTPLCCPFRGSLLTSLYPHQCVPGHEFRLPPEQPTLAHVFRENGYHTAWFGKWHLDGFHESEGRAGTHVVPRERRGGFDCWVGYENNNSQWDCHVHGGDASHEMPPTRLDDYETDGLTDMFLDHLTGLDREQPFFATLSVQPPHDPYVAPPAYMSRHNPATLRMRPNVPEIPEVMEQARRELAGAYAMIENLDDNVGRIVDWLRSNNLYAHTHIIFLSDHGDMHGSHGMFRKTNPFEESARIPFIVSGCQATYDGFQVQCSDAPLNHVDIAPTTLGLCGIESPDWMQGCDYSGLRLAWRPQRAYPDSAFLQLPVPTGHGDSTEFAWRAVVTRDGWKYAELEGKPWLLFHLKEDPYEQSNLALNSRYREKRAEMANRLAGWMEKTGDQWEPNDLAITP